MFVVLRHVALCICKQDCTARLVLIRNILTGDQV